MVIIKVDTTVTVMAAPVEVSKATADTTPGTTVVVLITGGTNRKTKIGGTTSPKIPAEKAA